MMTNKLPPNWFWVNAENICTKVTDGTHDTPKYIAKGIPLITSKNLKYNVIDFENVKYISQLDHEKIKKRSEVNINDLLFAMIGTIGNPVLVESKFEFSIKNVGLFKIDLKKIVPKYFQLWLSSFQLRKLLEEKEFIKGTTQKFIPLKNLRKIPIPLSPLPDQKKIVAKIEELYSELDNGIEQLKKAKEQIKTYRQAVLKFAFEGKLTNYKSLRKKDDIFSKDVIFSGKAAEPEVHYKHSELPKGWKWVKLGVLTSPSKERFEPLKNDNKKYIGLEHIEKGTGNILGYANSDSVRSTKTVFNKGDLLYGKLRPYLNKVTIAPFDGVCSTDILVFNKQDRLSNTFIKYRLLMKDFVNYAQNNMSGVQHPRVNFKTLSDFEIMLPSFQLQQQIVEEIESRFSVADKLEQTVDESLSKAEMLRQSILKQAFEGKLV